MSARIRSVLALASAITTAGALAKGQTQPAQTFRTRTDVVHVDVSVTDGGRAVTGLGPQDFVLTDNGVRQRIDSVDATEVPIDVTLVFDVSGDTGRSWRSSPPPARTAAAIRTEAAGVARILRPADRLRALAVDTRVQQLWPMRAARSLPLLPSVESGGMAALYDGLTAALLYPVEPARRHVVIARTKGIDNISSLDALAVRAIAERSDALLQIVSMETALDNEEALTGFQCRLMGYCWPTRRFWTPYQRRLIGSVSTLLPDGQAIAGAAEATGGGLHRASLFDVPTLTGIFKRTFDDFRTGYVLRYTPQGVPQGGWHQIEVRVARSRSARIRARTGYFVEEDAPAPKPAAVPERPRTLREFITTYEHGGWRQLTLGLREVTDPVRLLREFEDGGNPWPAAPRKEAAFALELVEPGVFSSRAAAQDAARELLERFRRLVRHPLEPDVFERYWYFAALTMLEGSIRPAVTEAFANGALARFPDEPRFLLSRAIAIDQRWAVRVRDGVVDAAGHALPGHESAVRAAYAAAIERPETATEARIRLAWFLHRVERRDEALARLTEAAAQPIADPALRYLQRLFLGHVLAALGRQDEAIGAFRGALAIVPTAQSARVALMNALLMRGDRAEAEALAERVQSDASNDLDPWWMYWQGQYRLQPQAMARIRELSR